MAVEMASIAKDKKVSIWCFSAARRGQTADSKLLSQRKSSSEKAGFAAGHGSLLKKLYSAK